MGIRMVQRWLQINLTLNKHLSNLPRMQQLLSHTHCLEKMNLKIHQFVFLEWQPCHSSVMVLLLFKSNLPRVLPVIIFKFASCLIPYIVSFLIISLLFGKIRIKLRLQFNAKQSSTTKFQLSSAT